MLWGQEVQKHERYGIGELLPVRAHRFEQEMNKLTPQLAFACAYFSDIAVSILLVCNGKYSEVFQECLCDARVCVPVRFSSASSCRAFSKHLVSTWSTTCTTYKTKTFTRSRMEGRPRSLWNRREAYIESVLVAPAEDAVHHEAREQDQWRAERAEQPLERPSEKRIHLAGRLSQEDRGLRFVVVRGYVVNSTHKRTLSATAPSS